MDILYPAAAFAFGTIWGSFFFTLALRYADGSMAAYPLRALFSSSRCPSCDERISPLYLVPLFGYLLLRGRCRGCGAAISPLYPLAEILFGAAALGFYLEYGPTPFGCASFFAAAIGMALAFVDVKTLTIPDSLLVALALPALYLSAHNSSLRDSLFGFLLLFGFFLIILLIFPGSFGGGDLKLASIIGLMLGFELSLVALETALVTGAIGGVIYGYATGRGLRTKMPFAPYLVAGMIVAFLWGRDLVLLYFRALY